jgi:hypothetical protein
MTYAQSLGQPAFNWHEALQDAINCEPDQDEHEALAYRAGLWVTCACAGQCSIIPRNEIGRPEDGRLEALGIRFSGNVENRKWRSAQRTLAAIEKRSAELIEAELQKQEGG